MQKMSAFWGSAFIHACSFAKHAPHRAPMDTPEDLVCNKQNEIFMNVDKFDNMDE